MNDVTSKRRLCKAREEWVPEIPPRSYLYNEDLIGRGTPMVESLTGFILRLSNAHSTSVSGLLSEEVVPLLEIQSTLKDLNSVNRSIRRISPAINGMRDLAGEMVRVLEKLTLTPDLHEGTMLLWAGLISPHGLVRQERMWCPECYHGWEHAGRTVYEPFIWSIRTVCRCPVHGTKLVSKCPHIDCRKEQSLLHWYGQPGYCFYCKGWLGNGSGEIQVQEIEDADSLTVNDEKGERKEGEHAREAVWEIWVSEVVGELLAASHTIKLPTNRPQIAEMVKSYLGVNSGSRRKYGELTALAAELQVTYQTMHNWCNKEYKYAPVLSKLLKICHYFDVRPLELLTGAIKSPQESFTSRYVGRIDAQLNPIEKALREALTSPAYPSVNSLAAKYGYYASTLTRLWPDLCRAVSERRREHYRAKRQPSP